MSRATHRILILYNDPSVEGAGPSGAFVESAAGVLDEVRAVEAACGHLGWPCDRWAVRRYPEIVQVLAGCDHDVVFNLVESLADGPEWACHVPATVRAMGKACTGNGTPGLLFSLDKAKSKAILSAAGVPCPQGRVFAPGETPQAQDLFEGPFIVKPICADASEGIDEQAVVRSKGRRLKDAIRRIHETLGQPALVEQFIEGRELNVSVIRAKGQVRVLPLAEIDFSAFGRGRPRIVGYEAKWRADSFAFHHTPRIIPAPLPDKQADEVRALADRACRALECRDYCRVDFRLDAKGRPYVLEVNANPDISPDAGFAAALEAAGIPYRRFVEMTVQNALARAAGRTRQSRAKRRSARPRQGRDEHRIRWGKNEDREAVVALLAESGLFRPCELEVAREVFDEAVAKGPQGHYQSYVVEVSGRVVGWVCYGPTPCAVGTYDLYWIGVAPDRHGQGLGKALMAFAERDIAGRGGARVIVETSGRQAYEATQRFYEALGYQTAARITDFYGPGDDKIVFCKSLRGN